MSLDTNFKRLLCLSEFLFVFLSVSRLWGDCARQHNDDSVSVFLGPYEFST